MRSADPAAACREVVQIYPSASGPVHALRGITVDLHDRTLTAVVGPSGAGKSTLLRVLACLERPTAGEVLVAGRATAALSGRARRRVVSRHVGFVFQVPSDNLLEAASVEEQVRLAWRMRTPVPRDGVDRLLGTCDLTAVARRRPAELSVGEQQRLALAMAVAGAPALLVADEPTANLDAAGAATVVDLLPRLRDAGQALVVCTHDPRIIAAADEVLAIDSGTLAAAGPPDDVLAVVDDGDRVHLPREAVTRFPERRARLVVEGDHVRLDPP